MSNNKINQEILEDLYCNKGLLKKEIADELNMSNTAVRYNIKKYNLKRKYKHPIMYKVDLEKIKYLYYTKDHSLKQIGRELNIKGRLIYTIAKELNIEIKDSIKSEHQQQIKILLDSGLTHKEIGQKLDISRPHVTRICLDNNWSNYNSNEDIAEEIMNSEVIDNIKEDYIKSVLKDEEFIKKYKINLPTFKIIKSKIKLKELKKDYIKKEKYNKLDNYKDLIQKNINEGNSIYIISRILKCEYNILKDYIKNNNIRFNKPGYKLLKLPYGLKTSKNYYINEYGDLINDATKQINRFIDKTTPNYYKVKVASKEKGQIIYKLHRLVYETFNGSIIKGYHVHHKDGDSFNNHKNNLELLSPKNHFKKHSKKPRRI